MKGLFEVGLPITAVASPAPANLGRVAADFSVRELLCGLELGGNAWPNG